jgi:hypothetical protein
MGNCTRSIWLCKHANLLMQLSEPCQATVCLQGLCAAMSTPNKPCCASDTDVQDAWCRTPSAVDHALYSSLCVPWYQEYGLNVPAIKIRNNELVHLRKNTSGWSDVSEPYFCDVLGLRQRRWLSTSLRQSSAMLNIVVAPGGLLGDPASDASASVRCDRHPWDCHRPAQVNLLHTLANATGCTLLISGRLLLCCSACSLWLSFYGCMLDLAPCVQHYAAR